MEKQSDKKNSKCMIPIKLNPNIGNPIYCNSILWGKGVGKVRNSYKLKYLEG